MKKIAIIVGDPEVNDAFSLSEQGLKLRPWLKNINNSLVSNMRLEYKILRNNGNQNIVRKTVPNVVNLYYSVYLYLKSKLDKLNDVSLIFPKDITFKNLKGYDYIFYNFFDPIAAAVLYNDPNKGLQMEKLLHKLDSKTFLMPSTKFTNLQHDKCKYYKYLSDSGIPIAPTHCLSKKEWPKDNDSKLAVCKRLVSLFKKEKWNRVFVKPVMGTSGTDADELEDPKDTSELLSVISDLFKKKYPKIVFQKFIAKFAIHPNPEIKMYYVGDSYVYSVVMDDRQASASLKQEGGTYTIKDSTLVQVKKLGAKVIKAIKPLFNGQLLLTRIDVGCCVKGKHFVNEIEYAPGFYTSFINGDKKFMIDSLIGDQMLKIIGSK